MESDKEDKNTLVFLDSLHEIATTALHGLCKALQTLCMNAFKVDTLKAILDQHRA